MYSEFLENVVDPDPVRFPLGSNGYIDQAFIHEAWVQLTEEARQRARAEIKAKA